MLKLIEMIVHREGIGNVLAEGPVRAAKEFGKGAGKFAIHVKGQPLPAHEPRGKGLGLALSYATAPQGADHCTVEHDILFESETDSLRALYPLGILEPVDRFDIGPKKIRLYVHLERVNSLNNVLGLCNFTSAILGMWRLPHIVQIVKAVTGWETSTYELMKVAERGINLARCFNTREGFTRGDDKLPDRLYEPLVGGINAGRYVPKEDFHKALDIYYEMLGWDPKTGIPRKTKLEELDIGWAQKDIPRHKINAKN